MTRCARLILIISLVTCSLNPQTVAAAVSLDDQWLFDAYGYGRVLELQRELKVPLVVYFYTNWCPYCPELDAN